jgi:hypothetical protein
MALTPDEQYRFDEQKFIEDLMSQLHDETEEGHIIVFGRLAQGMMPFLTKGDLLDLAAIESVHGDVELTQKVGYLWRLMIRSVKDFCQKEEGPLSATHMSWVLLKLHERLMESVSAAIGSSRMREAPGRIF